MMKTMQTSPNPTSLAGAPLEAGHTSAPLLSRQELSRSYQPGEWLDRLSIDTRSFSAVSGCYRREAAVSGVWHHPQLHYFDLRIGRRPPQSLGRFEDAFDSLQPLGDIVFVPAGYRFQGSGSPGKQRNLFVFLAADDSCPDGVRLRELITPASLSECINLRSSRIKHLLKQISRELYQPGFASELMLEGLGTSLLAETLRLFHHKHEQVGRRGGLSPRALRLIQQRIGDGEQPPTLAELAALCRLSRRHLMRAFQEETGQTLGHYVKQQMMEKASRLLRHSDLQISQIAARVGFTSAAAFSTAFRRSTGYPPRQFREQKASRPATKIIATSTDKKASHDH